mmetsp:Transcript_35662/g.83787  ORF Transcript_35662/g.83787 Transcript_35662/m.83787 type:complete len:340 (+) Transcript_35662:82-1101(+)
MRNLVGMCLAERLTGETPMNPPYLSRRNAEFYDLVKGSLSADTLQFVMNLCTRFSGDDYGTKLWAYLSALAGLENGALIKDLLGAECVAYLLSRAEFCSALDQIQLYLLLCFVQDLPSPLVRVSLPPVPMNAYRKALGKYCLAHETLQLVGNHPSAKLCAAVLGHHPSCNSTQLCMLLAEPGFRFPAGSLPSGDEYPLWTDALRFMLANGKGLHVGPRAHMLLALVSKARAKQESMTRGGATRLLYSFVQRLQSNEDARYEADDDLWYASVVNAHFLKLGPELPSFRASVACLLISALRRDLHKVAYGAGAPRTAADGDTTRTPTTGERCIPHTVDEAC